MNRSQIALEHFEALLDNLDNTFVWEGDARAVRVTYVSARAESVLGYPLERWAEPGFWQAIVHPDDREAFDRTLHEALSERKDKRLDHRAVRADRRVIWIHSGLHVVAPDGQPIERFQGVCVDITAAKEAEQKIRRQLDALLEAHRAKDEFLATMSHELRTPLTAILGWASLLRRDHGDESRLTHGLEVLERNAVAEARLVADLLDVSRMITGKLRLKPTTIRLADVVNDAADVVRPTAQAKGVRLVVDVQPPRLDSIVGDRDRLRQVVWNLLVNAIKFTPAGGLVVVSAGRSGPDAVLRVKDTGGGIPPEHLRDIFDRFRQLDDPMARGARGLGLGLAIVKHLVEAHGGTISAESDGAGRGSTFTVRLPVRAVTSPSPEEEGTTEKEEGRLQEQADRRAPGLPGELNGSPLRGVRALVVDDDDDSREVVRAVLEQAGARVDEACSGLDALDRLTRDGVPDVLVSDIAMPEVDGYTLIREVRSREATSKLPAVALTAYSRAEDAERARDAGFQRHLSKPSDPEALVAAVWYAVNQARNVSLS